MGTVAECPDKACSALNAKDCRYPGWRMCGHPTTETSPAEPVAVPPAEEVSRGTGGTPFAGELDLKQDDQPPAPRQDEQAAGGVTLTFAEQQSLLVDDLAFANMHADWAQRILFAAVERIVADRLAASTDGSTS